MSKIERTAGELAFYRGGDTANALNRSYWNDGVGKSIKGRIEREVENAMNEAKHYYSHRLGEIKTEDIESALLLAWAHLRS